MKTINNTIVAIATAHGIGSVAIVRISGRKAYEIGLKITKKEHLIPRFATLCYLQDKYNEVIDEAIVIYFKSPNSFTGEDIVEFQCHGGTAVADLVMNEVIHLGVRVAEPGEYSKRAFLNGKIDLTKAEAIAKLIETKNVDAVKILSRQLKGDLKKFVDDLRNDLVEILAYAEVNIDYAEEDLPTDIMDSINARLINISKIITNLIESSLRKEGLINGFNISIIGKPNVGKSSLLNKLLNCNRAIISDIAGTTRDTIEEDIRIGTHLVRIIDTAGVRDSMDQIEQIGVQKSIESIENSDIVLMMFDNSQNCTQEDEKIIDLIDKYSKNKKIFVFLNKNDLKNKFDVSKIAKYNPIEFSAKKDVNIVIETVKKYLDTQNINESLILTSKRQITEINAALYAIKRAYIPLENGELELFAYEINDAIMHIASITTEFERDEILDKMFGSFCLGK